MKKLAISLILGASLILTPSAFALKAMTDSNMKEATGQAGVSIALDDITLYQSVGESMYIDTDGIDGAAADAAGIVQSGVSTLTTIRAIVDHTNRGDFLKDAFGGVGYTDILDGTGIDGVGEQLTGEIEIAALDIDVTAECATMAAMGAAYAGKAGIVIGLPTLEICKTGSTKIVSIVAVTDVATGAHDPLTDADALISIEKSDSVMAILGGTLEIAAH